MSFLYNEILYRPLFNGLVFLYNSVAIQDLGLSIIFLTILIRIALFPLFHKTAKHQRLTQELQPHIKKIQEEHKDDKETQTKAILELYGRNKANPLTPILLLLVQLPILFAIYRVFISGFDVNGFSESSLQMLYPFVRRPENISDTLFSLVNLTKTSYVLIALAAGAQYLQGKLSLPKPKPGYSPNEAEKIGRNMIYVMPAFTAIILFNVPAAIALYWLITTGFSIIQQIIVNRMFSNGSYKTADK
ncbi:MAG: YidC/Oxa1 family membrane protein insertase [Candidatus Colwellbacteria bacterium]|nr:YidC/Oxa1 family membrane protein insertase [Candidatus Colwellbacteria bacterium]MBI3273827.1 YidC/Oxa1 family membrane protein insertase [Candidatus Colwellbacteria bacterium]